MSLLTIWPQWMDKTSECFYFKEEVGSVHWKFIHWPALTSPSACRSLTQSIRTKRSRNANGSAIVLRIESNDRNISWFKIPTPLSTIDGLLLNLRGNYGKPRQCASAASTGSQSGTVGSPEVGKGNFCNPGFDTTGCDKWYPAKADNGSAKKNSSSPESKMGKVAETVTTSPRRENHPHKVRKPETLTRKPEKNRRTAKSKVGASKGPAEEKVPDPKTTTETKAPLQNGGNFDFPDY
jgi:hypothetical protein